MVHSDHSPLLLNTQGRRGSKKPRLFRFQAAWLTDDRLKEVVEREWNQNRDFMGNIISLAPTLDNWNMKVFGNIVQKKRKLMARLAGIQKKILNDKHLGLCKLERKLNDELDAVLHQEEVMWFQKSREDWIVSGDRNTRFYHTATIIRRSRNKMFCFKKDDGTVISDK